MGSWLGSSCSTLSSRAQPKVDTAKSVYWHHNMCGFSVLLRLVILVGGALLALVGSDLIHLKVTLSYTLLDHLTPFILESNKEC